MRTGTGGDGADVSSMLIIVMTAVAYDLPINDRLRGVSSGQ